MALTVSTYADGFDTVMVTETDSEGTGVDNVTGQPCTVYTILVDNPSAAKVYLKLYDVLAPTYGTTEPESVLMVEATTEQAFTFALGQVFANGLSFNTTTGAAHTDTTNPASSVVVNIVARKD